METVMKEKKLDILALSWPIFVELLLQMLVGNADQIMVGWRDPNGVGAIGNANQITNLLLLVFSVVCTAAMILVSQYQTGGPDLHSGPPHEPALRPGGEPAAHPGLRPHLPAHGGPRPHLR